MSNDLGGACVEANFSPQPKTHQIDHSNGAACAIGDESVTAIAHGLGGTASSD
jgi:hypothetical protein